jgi:undecaprenyl-diphosphatase
MSISISEKPAGERRAEQRGHLHILWDVIYRGLRVSLGHLNNFRLALGVFLIMGMTLAVLGTWAFVQLAETVREGHSQAFDESVLRWIGQRQVPWVESALVEITMLGTGVVVLMVVGVAGLFLWLTKHRYSTVLLLVATLGGIVINNVMKLYFDRPRPQVFEWGTHAMSSSFPSGHSMSAVIVYTTVAYLAARLQKQRWARWATMFVALVVIALIGFSRMYLGVHYPSDVAAGAVVGLAWTGFCMATLEAIQKFAVRSRVVREEVRPNEEPPPAPAR